MIWTCGKNILRSLLASLLVMQNYYVCATLECKTFCVSGHYCNATDCIKCNNGFYMDAVAHKNTACKPWTQRNDPVWVKVDGGNATNDITWTCKDGYQEIYSSGVPECILVTQGPTLVSLETTTKLNYSSEPLATTQSPSVEIYIPAIVIPIVVSLVIVFIIVFIIVFMWYKKKACFSSKQKPKDPSVSYDNKKGNDKVDDGSTVVTPLLESGELNGTNKLNGGNSNHSPQSGELNGKNGDNSNHSPVKDTPNQSNNDAEELGNLVDSPIINKSDDAGDFNKFHKGNHSNNADDSHNLNIPSNDPSSGKKNMPPSLFPGGSPHSSLKNNLPPNDNQISDYSDVENRLYNAIEIFAYKLCEKLGIQADIIIHELRLKKFPDLDYKTSFKLGFSDWVRRKQFSYSQTNNGLWRPLDRLKVIIDGMERRDIIEEFDSKCKDITQILHEIRCQEQLK